MKMNQTEVHMQALVTLGVPAVAPQPNDIFARQRNIPLDLPELPIAVIGCGGVGSWIALFLALAGVPELHLYDSDVVSDHNLNRLPYGSEFLGKPKTESLASVITHLRPHAKMKCYPNFTKDLVDILRYDYSWLVVSTDSWASRRDIYDWRSAKHHLDRPSYIEAAAEGEFGSIAGSPADWVTPEEEHPGYQSVPVWVGPCVAAATMACAHILHRVIARDQSARFGYDHAHGGIAFSYRHDLSPVIAGEGEEVAGGR
jgi:ThiF family